MTLQDIQTKLKAGAISMVQLVQDYIKAIEQSKAHNIYIDVFEEQALNQAEIVDQALASGDDAGKLFGLVISIKDVICYKEHKVTAGSKILEGFESQFTSTALQRLLDEGAIVIGRTNCDEFAMGSSNENSVYGPTKNGEDIERVAGGSSGGAAVSVFKDTCHIALGTDTGGSVRQPAAFHGLIGMKPSYGRISRYGVIAYGSSFDQIGAMGKSLEDVALVIEIMSGYDAFDATSSMKPVETYVKSTGIPSMKIAVIEEVNQHPKLNPLIRNSTEELLKKLTNKGHTVNNVQFPLLEYLVPSYYVLTTAEASSNLGRYDGIRYGYRSDSANSINELYQKTRSEGFGKEVKRRIMLGTFVLSSGYYDAYYTKAQKVRRLVQEAIVNIFKDYDALLMPTTTNIAWKIGAFSGDPVEVYLSDIFTVTANLTGIPAISLPLGQDDENNHYGIQLFANKFQERKLFEMAQATLELA